MRYSYILIALVLIILGLFFARQYRNPTTAPLVNESQDLSDNELMGNITPTPFETKGTIEGSLSYPSETLPQNMLVCAENSELDVPICTPEKIQDKKYTYGTGFKLEVPEGVYTVYALIPGNEYKAYYNKFVECGLLASCTDHTPIEVTIDEENQTAKADPQDWYSMEPSI